jgi:TetR/AcrR family transcriptional regulator, transcriptional repressor for nem operon
LVAAAYLTTTHRDNIDSLVKFMPGRSTAARREKALAAMAGLIGALVLSRAVDDPAFSEEILKAAARTIGGTSPATGARAR